MIDNIINVYVYGRKLHAMVDTGAVSAIGQGMFNQLQQQNKFVINDPPTTHVQMANGERVGILGSVSFPVQINKQNYWTDFYILPHLGQDLILGLPFQNSRIPIDC